MGIKTAFQGERGAYSEAALLAHFGRDAEPLACPSFDRLFAAVADGVAEAGMVPIENSLAGSVLENYDLLLAHAHVLPIVGEATLRVRHCLLAKPGTRLEDVKVCYSHPQALAQSMPFLKSHGIEARADYDTAGSAKALSERDEPGAAAIASARAAEIYGLEILAEGIQTREDNTTRFFVIRREAPVGMAREKASLVFAAANQPGSLYHCMGVFARRGLNLTKLESRPTLDKPWEYYFYLDFEGDLTVELVDEVLGELKPFTSFMRLLGVYPRAVSPSA
jgi:prephenate dehydratase